MEESQRGQSLLEAQVTLGFDVVEAKLPVCVSQAAEDNSPPPASPGTGVSCSGTSATGSTSPCRAQAADEVCYEGFDHVLPSHLKRAQENSCQTLEISFSPFFLHSVQCFYTLCNLSQLAGVERKI